MKIAALASTILLSMTMIASQRVRADDPVAQPVDRCNVAFDSPSKDFHGAMPLGNGAVGISAWVEENGDLLFYIGKTDAYDDNNRLLKLGRVRVKLTPNPVAPGGPYREELRLGSGEFVVQAGKGDAAVILRLWVDANHPVIHLEAQGKRAFELRASLESWRTRQRLLDQEEVAYSDPFYHSGQPTIQYPDTILDGQKDRVVWYHHNAHSAWPATMKLQGLATLMARAVDPLLDRTFGAAIVGEGMASDGATALKSTRPRQRQTIAVFVLTQHPARPPQWLAALDANIARLAEIDLETARQAHRRWWRDFWNRSWIRLDGPPDAQPTTRGYALQRYLMVCGGRGDPWVKFNGSIFTLPYEQDPDFRRWGGANWFQNFRLLYWPMIASGDFDVMQPLFRTYRAALPLAQQRTRNYYGHDGALFLETSYFWGTYANVDYGWDRRGKPLGFAPNPYVTYYWSGSIEFSTILLDYFDYTQDRQFAADTLLPLASAIVRFYDRHYPRDARGKIRFQPAASLETWHEAVNPMPEIAGLKFVVGRLLELPADLTTASQRADWKRMLGELPELPAKTDGGKTFLLPADSFSKLNNFENPELYAVFPYRLFGVGREGMEIALETFHRRVNRRNTCWWQDDIHMACLGLAAQARQNVAGRLADSNVSFRFPAMWGPTNDEIPDMDHGGVGQIALQYMLLQSLGDKLLLFPAWPKQWNVEFKLHAPKQTVVEGVFRDGKLQQLKVTPESRAKNLVKLEPQ
jgi:hypothetical protein